MVSQVVAKKLLGHCHGILGGCQNVTGPLLWYARWWPKSYCRFNMTMLACSLNEAYDDGFANYGEQKGHCVLRMFIIQTQHKHNLKG